MKLLTLIISLVETSFLISLVPNTEVDLLQGHSNPEKTESLLEDISFSFLKSQAVGELTVRVGTMAFERIENHSLKQVLTSFLLFFNSDSAVTCHDTELVFTSLLTARSEDQLSSQLQAYSVFLEIKEAIDFGGWNGTVTRNCSVDMPETSPGTCDHSDAKKRWPCGY